MRLKASFIIIVAILFASKTSLSQTSGSSQSGWFSFGGRSTLSAFDSDGSGLGTGGQFRIRLSDNVNTEWFADYISITGKDNIRSTYYHIGWSVLFYPFKSREYPRLIQPYVLAGHCFDYNEKSFPGSWVTRGRWGSAVQAGVGTHVNLAERFDISLSSQYMIHLTPELEPGYNQYGQIVFIEGDSNSLEGHLLITLSMNYKITRLWKR